MEKTWLARYEPGVPHDIDPDRYNSLGELLEHAVSSFAARPALQSMGRQLSYAELDQLSHCCAAYLQQELRLRRGDRIALMMPNVLQYLVVLFGALRAGLVVVNVNPLYTPRELQHQLSDSGATTIVVLENFAHTVAKVLDQVAVRHVIITRMGDLLGLKGPLINFAVKYVKKLVKPYVLPQAIPLRQALARGMELEFQPVKISGNDLAFLQYTGGTTGVAKGAMLTHRNMVANLEQASAWVAPQLQAGQEVVITALPIYHIFSLTVNCLVFMKLGAKSILITNPRDIGGFIKTLKRNKFSVITGVNTLFNALLNHADFASLDFSGVKISLGGGMAVQRAVAERWHKVTGCQLIEGYGLTECSPIVSVYPLNMHGFNGTIGLPVPSTDISIRDDQGRELPQGEHGELFVRGPQVMQGYWKRQQDTQRILGSDGYLATGDMAMMDAQGFIKLVDRKKDMILVSGFNVYPNEIEDVVAELPGVREVACIGLPDEACGERPKLFVVRNDTQLSPERIIAHCRAHLTGYKIPREVEFRDELPKTNVGKILRRALRDESVFAEGTVQAADTATSLKNPAM